MRALMMVSLALAAAPAGAQGIRFDSGADPVAQFRQAKVDGALVPVAAVQEQAAGVAAQGSKESAEEEAARAEKDRRMKAVLEALGKDEPIAKEELDWAKAEVEKALALMNDPKKKEEAIKDVLAKFRGLPEEQRQGMSDEDVKALIEFQWELFKAQTEVVKVALSHAKTK